MIHAGHYRDTYFLLDVESGAVHEVDELAYKIGKGIEEGKTADAIKAELSDYAEEDVNEVFSEFDELREMGMLETPCLYNGEKVYIDPAIKSMCLHIAHDCNLRCSYCFAAEGTYMGDRAMMTKEVARAAIDFLMVRSKNRKHLEVDLFGGEPLINFDVVKDVVAYGREQQEKFGKEIRFTLTTNAYHVTDEMADFINKEMKNLVISVDGRKEVHDAQRKNAAGKGSWDKVTENAKKLIAGRGDKEYYIRGTYTAANLDFTEDVKAIADLGFDQISVEPVVTADGDLKLDGHIDEIDAEYRRLGEEIEKRRAEGKGFNFFHFMMDFTGGPCLSKRLRGCGAGTEYVAVTPSGDVYPCHQFAGKKEYLMGNVLEGTETSKDIETEFSSCHVYSKPKCSDCFAKYFCSGGCAAAAYNANGNINIPHELSCDIQRARLDTAIGLYLRR